MTPKPTNNDKPKPLCKDAWAVPPSPRMLDHGNNYHTCSVCGEKVNPATNNDEVDKILEDLRYEIVKSHTEQQLWADNDDVIFANLKQAITTLLNERERKIYRKAVEEFVAHLEAHHFWQPIGTASQYVNGEVEPFLALAQPPTKGKDDE